MPVVATVARGVDGELYNVNADTAAAALAVALGAEKLVVLTDVEGLYADWPATDEVISEIDADELADAAARPVQRHGPEDGGLPARPCRAASRGPTSSTAGWPHSLLLELFTDEGVGTMVVPVMSRRRRTGSGRPLGRRAHGQLRHPAGRAGAGQRRHRLGRRRQASTSTCSAASPSTCSATPTRPSSRRSPGRSRRSATPATSPRTRPASSSPSGSRSSSAPAPTAGCCSPTPAPRPTRPRSSCRAGCARAAAGSPARAPSTAARWARSRSPASPPSARRSSRCPARSPSCRTATPPPCAPPSPADHRQRRARARAWARPASSCRPRGFLEAAREACDAHGALLHLDEVQGGVGRVGGLADQPASPRRASSPTSSRWPRRSAAACRSARSSPTAGPPTALAEGRPRHDLRRQPGRLRRRPRRPAHRRGRTACSTPPTALGAHLRSRLEGLGHPLVARGARARAVARRSS